MKDFHLSKKFWSVITALVVIGALFAYYLLVHVKGREADIIAEKYRILKRIGKNAIAIKTDYDKRIDNYSRTYAKAKPFYDKVVELENELFEIQDELYYMKLDLQDPFYTTNDEQRKNAEKNIKLKNWESNKKEKERKVELDKIEGIDSDLKINLKSMGLEIVPQKYESIKYDNLDTLYFKIRSTASLTDEYTYTYDYYGRSTGQTDSCLAVSLKLFLNKSNFSYDQFNEFFLIRVLHRDDKTDSGIAQVNNSTSGEQSEDNKKAKGDTKTLPAISAVAFQTFDNKIDLNSKQLDSLFVEDHGLRSVSAIDISLSGTTYKMFPHRMQFATDEEWILCGLVKSNDFKKHSREIDTWKLAFTFLVVILLFLAMPILKLMIMSAIERVRIINVWSAGFSLIVGTAFLLLILLSANEIVGYKIELDNRLAGLSESIKSRFIGELNTIYNQLDVSKTIYKTNPTRPFELRSDVFNSSSDSIEKAQFPHHRFFNEIIWLDKEANQRLRITSYKQDSMTIPLKLGERKYFTRPLHDSLWILKDRNDPKKEKKLALQSIRSWISGKHEAGVSIKLDSTNGSAVVLAMATKLYSVMDPILPPGYGFCIIDESGEALFHSETKRNTQENFLDEAHQSTEVKASMSGRMAKRSIEVLYKGNAHRLFIQPIDGFPLYLITFYDLEYYKAPMILTLYFTLMLIILLFSLQGLQLFLLFVSMYKSTKLKTKRFFLKWLRPRKNLVKDSIEVNHKLFPAEKYLRSIVVQAILILLLFPVLFFMPHSHAVTFCFLILPIYLFTFQYFLLERDEIIRDRKKLQRHPFLWLSAMLVILINLSFFGYIDDFVTTIIVQIVLLGILVTGFHLKQPIRKLSEQEWIAKRHFGKLYFIMVLMWLSITSALPVLYFYHTVSFEENLTWKKYLVWETARQDFIRDNNLKREKKLPQEDYKELKAKGDYILSTGEFNTQPETSKYTRFDTGSFYELQFKTHPPFSGLIERARGMLSISTADKKWKWTLHEETSDALLTYTNDDGQVRYYAGLLTTHPFWKADYFLLFFVLFVAFGYLVYSTTNFIVRTIFGLGLVTDNRFIEYAHEEVTADQILNILNLPSNSTTSNENNSIANLNVQLNCVQPEKILLVGLPYSGKSELLAGVKLKIIALGISVEDLDFRKDLKRRLIFTGQKVFIVSHFEHGLTDHRINQEKIECLQRLLSSGAHLILSSTVQPSAVLEFYESAIQRINPQKNEELRKEWVEYKHAIRMWKNLVSGFIVLYQPLQENLSDKITSSFVKSELLHGYYLTKTALLLEREPHRTYEEKENYVLRVEELAETYYHSLWNSFSNSEKHVLYDLAKDRFVNLRSLTTIRMLMQKGVIIAEDTLNIMNKSFSNFILTVVSEDEEMRMEKELHQKGAWSMVRSVLIIALIGLATFITLAQQNLLQDFNLLLGAVGSVAALLARFGGLFATSKVKEP